MQLPKQDALAQRWELFDFPRPFELNTPAAGAAGATVRVTIGPVPDDELWFIDRLSVSSTSTTATRFRIYENEELPTKLLDGTNAGNLAIADEFSPIQLSPGSVGILLWLNASSGAVGSARVQYRVYKRRQQVA